MEGVRGASTEVQMMVRSRGAVAAAVLLALSIAGPALAQKTTGDITGTGSDTTGAVLPGVLVTATCPATNLTRTAPTDERGGFSLPDLPICTYNVTTTLQGFRTVARDVQVSVNTLTKADFKLDIGAQSETITLAGPTPSVHV